MVAATSDQSTASLMDAISRPMSEVSCIDSAISRCPVGDPELPSAASSVPDFHGIWDGGVLTTRRVDLTSVRWSPAKRWQYRRVTWDLRCVGRPLRMPAFLSSRRASCTVNACLKLLWDGAVLEHRDAIGTRMLVPPWVWIDGDEHSEFDA